MEIPCDYLAVDWAGFAWVRYEECFIINKNIKIGQRDWRIIITTDQGRCRDSDPKDHTRHRIGELEWVCILKRGE